MEWNELHESQAFIMAALRSRCGHYNLPCGICLSSIFMAALWNRAGQGNLSHYNFILSFALLSSFFFSSPNLSRRRLDVYTWYGLSANLGCRSETFCTRLAENTGRKKSPKIHHLCTIAQICPAMSSQLRHVSTVEKNLLNSNISPTCSYNMVNFGPLTAEIVSLVWGTPPTFNRFRILAA